MPFIFYCIGISSIRLITSPTSILLRSCFAITRDLRDQGFQLTGLLGPNKVIDSLFTEAAICDATESKPIKNLAPSIRAARPIRLVLPARLNTF